MLSVGTGFAYELRKSGQNAAPVSVVFPVDGNLHRLEIWLQAPGRDLGRLAGLRRIGIDETSYRKGRRHLLVVTRPRHGSAGVGRQAPHEDTLSRFFDNLGDDRAAQLIHVSADGAEWIPFSWPSRS
jgi:hypothetical protein